MTKAEYAEYEERFAAGLKYHGANRISTGDSAGFSASRCDLCNRHYAGDRFEAEAGPFDLEVCTDCAYYAEYGQLDDLTMISLT